MLQQVPQNVIFPSQTVTADFSLALVFLLQGLVYSVFWASLASY